MTDAPTHYFTIDDFSIHDGDRQVSWQNHVDLLYPGSGTREAALLIEIDVDGQMDLIHGDLGQTTDLVAIERAIIALQRLQAGLIECYPEGARWAGRCIDQNGWGRCRRHGGHDGDHRFPTESEVVHELTVLGARGARRGATA